MESNSAPPNGTRQERVFDVDEVAADLQRETEAEQNAAEASKELPYVFPVNSCFDKYVSFIVERPFACCGCCGCTIFVLGVLAVVTGGMNLSQQNRAWEIIEADSTQWSMVLNKAREQLEGRRLAGKSNDPLNEKTRILDASRRHEPLHREAGVSRRLAKDECDVGGGMRSDEEKPSHCDEMLHLFYKSNRAGTGTIFTPERLKEICEMEKKLFPDQNDILNRTVVLMSPVSVFYLTGVSLQPVINYTWDCTLLSSESVAATSAAISKDLKEKGTQSRVGRLLSSTMMSTGESVYSASIFQFFGEGKWDRAGVVLPLLESLGLKAGFLKSAYTGEDDRFVPSPDGHFRVRLYYTGSDEDFIMQDFSLALGSMVVVFLIMWIHLRSLFSALFCMYQILFSLPLASILYRHILRISYFDFIHILSIYLVLGIGADDVFVLFDTWRHMADGVVDMASADGRCNNNILKRVLKQTVSRAGHAVFNTSFTTTAAFLSCSVSKLMPMRTTGWYAAICIVFNFVLVLTFTPSVLILYHQYFEGKRCCCPPPVAREKVSDETWAEMIKVNSEKEGSSTKPNRDPLIERFMMHVYARAMSWQAFPGIRPVAIFAAVATLGVAIQGAYFASTLTPPTKPEEWFPDNHMLTGIGPFQIDTYFTSNFDRYTEVQFVWGINRLSIDSYDRYKPDDFEGTVVWDDDFDLSNPKAQAGVLQTCKALRERLCKLDACKNAGFAKPTLMLESSNKTYACFLEDFYDWLATNKSMTIAKGSLAGADFLTNLAEFRSTEQLEKVYNDGACMPDYFNDIGFVGDRLRFIVVRLLISMDSEEPYSTGVKVMELLEDLRQDEVEVYEKSYSGLGLESLKFVNDRFGNYALGGELLSGFFSGCSIALPISFIVLLLSTYNILIAIYAVVAVGSIVLCVLGFCKSAMDWDLGIGEAIAGVIVIGYSVDYVVHLSHIYCEAREIGLYGRSERTLYAIKNMGSTVFAGAITTAGSGCVMFFCFITFFVKMAWLITMTIFFSFLFSLFFLMGVLWSIGPQGDFGFFDLRIRDRIADCVGFVKPKAKQ